MKKLLTLFRPLPFSVLILLIVSSFLRYYLYIYSTQLTKEFKNQNYKEVFSQDTLKLASRLNSLSSAINWVCIQGQVGSKEFYSLKKGTCKTGLLKQKIIMSVPQANNTQITFTIRLPAEVEYLFITFLLLQVTLIAALIVATRKSEENKREAEIKINRLARQVSHDIRSPLATLNTILINLPSIPEEEKKLINKSIFRINEISNKLLNNSRKKEIEDSTRLPRLENVDINEILLEIINEKRIEYTNLKKDQISYITSINRKPLSYVDASELKVLISNLINNSIESSPIINKLKIDIILSNDEEKSIVIEIKDNGNGIPEDILNQLGKVEISTKKHGNGLGMQHAFSAVKGWGGDILIKSATESGTSVKICLSANAQFNIDAIDTILVDDDELVRLTWQSRAKKNKIKLTVFSSTQEFEENISLINKNADIYIDSQLSNDAKGEDFAIILHERGFKNISITSGYDSIKFKNLFFLKKIISKSPPW